MNSVDHRLNPSLKRKDKLNLMKTRGKNNTEILTALPRYCIFINAGLWQLYAEQACWRHFSLLVCASRFGKPHSISSFLIIIIFLY